MSISPTAYFTVIKGIEGLIEIPVLLSLVVAGNSDAADIKLENQYVSRRHFQVRFDVDTFYISDLGSTNGTWVGGQRLKPLEEHILRNQAEIGLAGGRVRLKFSEVVATMPITTPIEDVDSGIASTSRDKDTLPDIWVDSGSRDVSIRGKKLVTLPKKEFDILECLFQKRGIAVSRDEIAAAGWPERPNDVPDQDIDQYIRRLRRKIEETPSHPKLIVTRVGYGYMIS